MSDRYGLTSWMYCERQASTRPMSPRSRNSRVCSHGLTKRAVWATMNFRPLLRTASTIRAASALPVAMGLVQTTCLPASSARTQCSACRASGVYTATMSSSGSSSIRW